MKIENKYDHIAIENAKLSFFDEQKKALIDYNLEKNKKAAAKKYELPRKVLKKYSNCIDTRLLLNW